MEKLSEKAKRGSIRRWPLGMLAVALVVSVPAFADSTTKATAVKSPSAPSNELMARTQASLANLPLSFEVNRGQTDAKVDFLTRAQSFTVFLMSNETVITGRNGNVLRMKLQNANQSAKSVGEDRQAKVTNYYIGNDPSKWQEGVPNFGQVRYRDVYSGIDMVYHSDQRQLEYDFVVKPGVDANQIRMAFEGASSIRITENGDLEIVAGGHTSVNHKPVVYQMINGSRKLVNGEYALAKNVVSFKVGDYDKTQPLVIDPTLQVLTFYGGTLNDEAAGIATSQVGTGAGVVFVGRSQSPALPVGGATKPSININWDAFATGLNAGVPGVAGAAGTTILWTSYFGGVGDDASRAVALDNVGNAYVAGYTVSADFPIAGNNGTNYDAFVVKLAVSSGTRSAGVLYGGPGAEQATSIALDFSTFSGQANALQITNPAQSLLVTAPNVVIGGFTTGNIGAAGTGPTTVAPDGYQTQFNTCRTPPSSTFDCGNIDGFIAIFNSALVLQHATYLGGGGNDQVNGVAVDIWGNIYATGFATPGIASIPLWNATNGASPFFPVVAGIGTDQVFDAALARGTPQPAVAFAAKFACTINGLGVPSPVGPAGSLPSSQIFNCNGKNTLKTLANSAMWGGSGTTLNPHNFISFPLIFGTSGQNIGQGISEAGLAIAVDQNGWGVQSVTSNGLVRNQIPEGLQASAFNIGVTTADGVPVATGMDSGYPDIVPHGDVWAVSSTTFVAPPGTIGLGPQGSGVSNFAQIPGSAPTIPGYASANIGGFQPGLTGPRVYIVGSTGNADFTNSLSFPACGTDPIEATGFWDVPPICPSIQDLEALPFHAIGPPVNGGSTIGGGLPNPNNGPARVGRLNNGENTGQTQGWLVALEFPAPTQTIVSASTGSLMNQPGNCDSNTGCIDTLTPGTTPVYVVLQPPTCPGYNPTTGVDTGCVQGANPGNSGIPSTNTGAPPACGFNAGTDVTCPTAFIGAWTGVAVDTDQQVYVIGQIGMSGATLAVPGVGLATRFALETERINRNGVPELLFPNPAAPVTSSFIIDAAAIGAGTVGTTAGNYCQSLPGAPPSPNPDQPMGLSCGIAVNATREDFFVGTTNVPTPSTTGTAGITAQATVNVTGGTLNIGVCPGGAPGGPACPPPPTGSTGGGTGYTTNGTSGGSSTGTCTAGSGGCPSITLSNVVCTTAPGPWTITITGGVITLITPASSGAGCTASGGSPSVVIGAPPTSASTATTAANLAHNPIEASVAPTLGTQFCGPTTALTTPPTCPSGTLGSTNAGREDVLYGAMQFYDYIATPSVVNFTANLNNFNSLTGPSGTGVNHAAIINFTNWQSQALNIPPGCTITPLPQPITQPGTGLTYTPFLVTQVTGTSQFQVSVNANALTPLTAANPLSYPGVVTQVIKFAASPSCAGTGGVPVGGIDNLDPVIVTLTVAAPLNLSPEDTFVLTSKLATGVVDQFCLQGPNGIQGCTAGNGKQLVPNQTVTSFIDVSTASPSFGPINFMAQIVPGQNWAGAVTNAITVPVPVNTIWEAVGPSTDVATKIPVTVNTQVLAGLPTGTYKAWIMFSASPETPDMPAAGSTACAGVTGGTVVSTTNPVCIPVSITIGSNVVANIPAAIVFGASTTPGDTSVTVANGTTAQFSGAAGYAAIPVVGTALPANNVFFKATNASTFTSFAGNNSLAVSINPGGAVNIPIQVSPAGLNTGVYSGQILVSSTGTAGGATPQTTVPIIIYVGPKATEDLPSNQGLGLQLPVNVPPVGLGTLASVGSAPGSPGSYPLSLSVPSGIGPNGLNQIPNPTLIQVAGLSNNSFNPFSVAPPTTTVPGVSFTNVGGTFGSTPTACAPTFAQTASLPGSPLGPPCDWALWVDATALNGTNTTRMAACGPDPNNPGSNNFGVTGTMTFSPTLGGNFTQFSPLVVPLTVCVTDFPSLTLGMPNTFPNPTFGPSVGTGFGTCNGGNPACMLAQPSNVIPGFPISIVDMVLATSTGTTIPATSAPVNLFAQAGNSSQVCKVLDIRTNGGTVSGVTIQALGAQFVTIQPAPAVFQGPPGGAPNSLSANSTTPIGTHFVGGNGVFQLAPISNNQFGQFAAGPFDVTAAMQTFQICVNTDPVGNAAGTFSTTVTINGGGVGAINIPVNMIVANPGTPVPTPGGINRSQLAVMRNTTSGPNTGLTQWWFAGPSNTFDASTKGPRWFGLNGDIAVAGDWDGSGVVRIGVFRCPASGVCQWYIDLNNNGQWDGTFGGDAIWNFGLSGDQPVVGDWNGTGVSKIGVMRCPASGQCTWYLDIGNKHTYDPATVGVYAFGLAGDKAVVGPYAATTSGSGFQPDNIGVFRCPAVGVCQWFVDSIGQTGLSTLTPLQVTTGAVFNFGLPGDQPVVGDWNGTGTKRIGVFRGVGGTGQWFVDTNGNHQFDPGADQIFNFGLAGDQGVTGFWTLP